jgi:NAD(P)-dependent dehydrogenase (short-subunit alcohol dehydrogenase family)
MALRGEGTIVHISSDASVAAYARWGAYSVSKAAQDHLGRVLAAELADLGVRVFSVDPGEMDTEMHRDAMPEADVASLARPDGVARRIVGMIQAGTVADGSRVLAASFAEAG